MYKREFSLRFIEIFVWDGVVVFCLIISMTRKINKVTFPLSYFSVRKSTKSQQGGLAPSSLQPPRRARVSRASHAWQVCAAKGQREPAV